MYCVVVTKDRMVVSHHIVDVLLSTYYLQIEVKWNEPPEVVVIPIDGRGRRLAATSGRYVE